MDFYIDCRVWIRSLYLSLYYLLSTLNFVIKLIYKLVLVTSVSPMAADLNRRTGSILSFLIMHEGSIYSQILACVVLLLITASQLCHCEACIRTIMFAMVFS